MLDSQEDKPRDQEVADKKTEQQMEQKVGKDGPGQGAASRAMGLTHKPQTAGEQGGRGGHAREESEGNNKGGEGPEGGKEEKAEV